MWKIIDLKYRLSDGVAIEVTVEYRLSDGNTISRKIETLELDEPTGEVTPLDQLSEEQVLSWFKSKVDYQAIETKVNDELLIMIDKRDNKITENKLPWGE